MKKKFSNHLLSNKSLNNRWKQEEQRLSRGMFSESKPKKVTRINRPMLARPLKVRPLINAHQTKKTKINHYGDWARYPYSNWLYVNGIKPSRKIDRDGDGIVDWEDCDPYDRYQQGIWSTIKSAASKVGSAISGAVKSVVATANVATGGKMPTSSSSTPSSSSVSKSSSSGGSSGGSSSKATAASAPVPSAAVAVATMQASKTVLDNGSIIRSASKGRSSNNSIAPQVPTPAQQEVVQQQLEQIRAIAGADPNLITQLSPGEASRLIQAHQLERRQIAVDRLRELMSKKKFPKSRDDMLRR